ncbi:phage tail protein [Ligilactobacillus pobuzihii]|uniref:phage tail protein n=1 Tax=Ligilactobacillus pobuzihii TaxID=449659 RepID=UPI0019D071C6|nr:phage tail protein [Ligilactobacillus pobuzihii]MBN7275107.1 phage tail protein [Ligilactobacillus pobuzihii]
MIDKYYFKNAGFDVEEESFTFGEYNSMDNRMFLTTREAPTPSEREIVETVPYMQGVYDFSQLNGGERYFDNREITYQVMLFEQDYPTRKYAEQEIKRQLMPLGIQPLYDSHDNGYHWMGKCKSVTVDDDEAKGTLTCTVVFDCYPFAIYNEAEGSDIWDDVYFPHWIFQKTHYIVHGVQPIRLFNLGSKSVQCELTVIGKINISGPFGSLELSAGNYKNTELVLSMGENNLVLSGNGSVDFKFYREEMI